MGTVISISKVKNSAGITLAALLLTACATSSHMIIQPATVNLSTFDGLVINTFTDNVRTEASAEVTAGAAVELQSKIIKLKEKNPEAPFFASISIDKPETDKPLVATCTVIGYDEGNRAARLLIGFGAGKATASVMCKFKSREGELIADVTFTGEKSVGAVLGGNAAGSIGALLDDIIGYMSLNY